MPEFSINYDLKDPANPELYQNLEEFIKSNYPGALHVQQSLWLVRGNYQRATIEKSIRAIIRKHDKLTVLSMAVGNYSRSLRLAAGKSVKLGLHVKKKP